MRVHRRRSVFLRLGAALTAAATPAAHAQMHHVDAPQRVTRAIGVYEWTGDLAKPAAARFVPVSLYIDGRFEDAGLYLARPIPFALQPGDVYSLERAGEPAGLLDLDFARHVVTGKALADDNPAGAWYGFGKFTPETPTPAPHLHASGHLTPVQSSAGPNTPAGTKLPTADTDDRPHMTRRDTGTPPASGSGSQTSGTSQSGSSPTSTDGSPSTSSTPSTSTPSTSTPDTDDTDRPTLRRRDPSQDASRRREYGAKSKTSGVTAAGPALGDDPDRPILGRGTGSDEGTPELTGLPPDLHQAVAVSDATHHDAHPFARAWDSPAEKTETLASLEAIAKTRLAAYLATNKLVASRAPVAAAAGTGQATAPVPAAPSPKGDDTAAPPRLQRGVPQGYGNASPARPAAGSDTTAPAPPPASTPLSKTTPTHHPARPAATVRPAPLTLVNQEVSGFTLSYGGLPTFIYTAAAAVAPQNLTALPSASTTSVAYITVVAQRLPSGELQAALTTVTDDVHLDRSPRLRLIDAVDPDDSHRASLLFELRGTSSRQFALYRLTSAQAEQTFTTASIE